MKINVHVIPKSRETKILGYDDWRKSVVVKLKSPPEGGKANSELEKLLSELFETKVIVVSGHRSRRKVVEIHNLSRDEVYDRLKRIQETGKGD